jgi:hypothetical protein
VPAVLDRWRRNCGRLGLLLPPVMAALHRALQQLQHCAKRLVCRKEQEGGRALFASGVAPARRAVGVQRTLCFDSKMLLRSCSCVHVASETSSGPGSSRSSPRVASCCAPGAPATRGRFASGAPASPAPERKASKRLRSVMATVATPAVRASCRRRDASGPAHASNSAGAAAACAARARLEIRGGVDGAWVPRRKLSKETQHVQPVRLLHAGCQQRVARKAGAASEGDAVVGDHRAARRGHGGRARHFSRARGDQERVRAHLSSAPAAAACSSNSSAASCGASMAPAARHAAADVQRTPHSARAAGPRCTLRARAGAARDVLSARERATGG